MKYFLTIIFLFGFGLLQGQSTTHQDVQVQLVSETKTIQPGKNFYVGIYFQLPEHTHIYWKNPGNSGLPTQIHWTLPQGMTASPILWPYPKRLKAFGDVTYGYENRVLLMSKITGSPNVQAGDSVNINAKVEWLLCSEACVPGQSELSKSFRIEDKAPEPDNTWINVFQSARKQLPQPTNEWEFKATAKGKQIEIQVLSQKKPPEAVDNLIFFPEQESLIDDTDNPKITQTNKGYQITMQQSQYLQQLPKALKGVLVLEKHDHVQAVSVNVPLEML